MGKNHKSVSIIMLTKNAGPIFEDVLRSISSQSFKDFEILVIDSNSNDNTVKTAKGFSEKIINIKREDFNHGKTRNYGVKMAKGDIVVFLTQDAIPQGDNWLINLVKEMDNKNIAGVFGKQIARENAIPMEKFYYRKMYGNKRIIWNSNNINHDEIIFSNVSSAIKKDILLENPFSENILMSEDMEWAYRMIDEGYDILYQPLSVVNHSHNSSAVNIFKRYFDFGVSHSQILNNKKRTQFLGKGLSVFLEEIKYIISKKEFRWIPKAIIYYLMKFMGLIMGRNQKFLPGTLKARFSNYRMYWK